MQLPRALNPVTNPAGLMAAAGAVLALFTRQVVTPVADPKSVAGEPLVTISSVLPPGTYGTPVIAQITPNPTGGTIGHTTDSPSGT